MDQLLFSFRRTTRIENVDAILFYIHQWTHERLIIVDEEKQNMEAIIMLGPFIIMLYKKGEMKKPN